jgi:hypothetical protein
VKWNEEEGITQFASFTSFFVVMGIFLLVVIPIGLGKEILDDRKHAKRMGTYEGNLAKDIMQQSFYWLIFLVLFLALIPLIEKFENWFF